MVDDDIADKNSPENEGKVSSSSQRMRLLGCELKASNKSWDKDNSPYLIGLTGGSCGGKTNIAKYLGKWNSDSRNWHNFFPYPVIN